MKKIILITLFFSCSCLAQFEFSDDFDQYISGQQLCCQNPVDWTTWSNFPCSYEDPFLSTNFSFSSPNSLLINPYNDLIKLLGNISSGRNYFIFAFYIPNNKTGYFSILSKFDPDPYEWGMECFFDVDGIGRVMLVPGQPIVFNYTNNQWQYVQLVVDFNIDEAQFWIDYDLIHVWQWSQNGTITNQLAAHNFYGPLNDNEMYIDNFVLREYHCLFCFPPYTPNNLIAQEIFNPDPQVQLNWQDTSPYEYAFKIIRKSGLPNDPSNFEFLSYVPRNIAQYVDTAVVIDSTYTYGVIAFNPTGYSDTSNFATITVEPLPVELVSFTFNVQGNNIQLNWTTATETNNQGFEIERTSPIPSPYHGEGGEAGRGWEKIGFVNAHGTTTEPQFYSFIDETVEPGKYQYRLKQIDFDGSFEYSKIVEVTIEAPNEFSLEQNYPNPFNPSTKIKYTIPSATLRQAQSDILVTLKVYDILGNEVATLVNEEKPAGEYEVEFTVGQDSSPDIASGIYFFQLKAVNPSTGSGQGFIEIKKMLLLK